MGHSKMVITQLFFIYPCIILSYLYHHGNGNSIDQSALLAFKQGIVADPQNVLSNWNKTIHICKWNGISCSANEKRVSSLALKSKNLQGTISPYLSNVSCLEILELSDNSFQGPLPVELGALSSLEALGLQGNNLQNEIPNSFGLLKNLRYIDLSQNQLQGSLPITMFYNCTELDYVDLSNNFLTGLIPPQIGNHLPYLENLLLYLNYLTGNIPNSLSNSSKMTQLDLENNILTGKLPSEMVMRMPLLKILHLSYNNLSSDENNTNLTPFFNSLSNLSYLEELELAANNLGGEFPSTISFLHVILSKFRLQDNCIHGTIPPNIGNLSNLTLLNLSGNRLNGTIPSEISLLTRLERLWLSNNFFQGEIPASLGVLNYLGLFDLSRNRLSGAIPTSLANLTQLRRLLLNGNMLSGIIPSSLGRCINLEVLDLSHNRLTGTIAAEVAGLNGMIIYFNLSNNLLSGTLPMELSKMDKVWEIDLSSNKFSGDIPSNLGSCKEVALLNLSHNSLHGPVPGTLGNLLNLHSLDLSLNFLSGEIPASLQKCSSLEKLNLSFNNFSGPLPTGGLFDSLPFASIEGNPQICGSLLVLPRCPSNNRSMIHSRRFLLLIIVASIAVLLTIFCMAGSKRIRSTFRQKEGEESKSSPDLMPSYQRITYRELWEATEGFDQSRLIGSGGFGRVYRGVLHDGTVVAIKVLQLHPGNSTKSFSRECQILKRIRHRNLMRIITTCSLPEFKALVLPFMANGSLENHLYPQGQHYGSLNLRLTERVNICSDIAEGVAYLHHHSPVQVIHCDLKPGNILLNGNMTALVSDFGIARLVMTVGEGSMTVGNTSYSTANLLCGSIGYVAPEYGFGRTASTKGDVYSFGVLVLEMLTGKRPTDDMFSGGLNLQKWVKIHYYTQYEKVIDSFLLRVLWDQNHQIRQMWEFVILELLELGLLCTQEAPSIRPTMIDVAGDLDRLKHYLGGDTTAISTSSHEMPSSTVTGGDYW